MWLVLLMKRPENLFSAVDNGPGVIVMPQDGDPIGFCPVFATKAEAVAAYPRAQVMEMRQATEMPDHPPLPPCICPSAMAPANPNCPRCRR